MHRSRQRSHTRKPILALSFGLVLTGLLITVFEGVHRAWEAGHHHVRTPSEPDLKYRMAHSPRLNQWGHHDRDRTQERQPDVFRVAVLGDSITYDIDLPVDTLFTAVAEDLLQASHPGTEVLNFGGAGYDIQQIATKYRVDVEPWKPDLVVYAYHSNDHIETQLVMMGSPPRPFFVGTTFPSGIQTGSEGMTRWLHTHSAIYRRHIGAKAARYLQTHSPSPATSRAFFETWFDQLVANVGSRDLMVMAIPHHALAAPNDTECARFIEGDAVICSAMRTAFDHATAHARSRGLEIISAMSSYQSVGVEALLKPHDTMHPNTTAHRLLGGQLADFIQARLRAAATAVQTEAPDE